MSRTIPLRSSRSLVSVLLTLLLLVGSAFTASPVAAGSGSVKTYGYVTEARIDTDGGCEKWTLVLWSAVPGASSYTMDMHDTLGYSFVAAFPPFQYDEAFGGLPAVGGGQHRHALTYQGGGVGGCQANDVARYTIRSLVANFDNDDARIVGTVADRDGSPVPGVPISISGPTTVTKRTNGGGAYGTKVKKGRYTVSAPAGFCVRGTVPCKRSKAVTVDGLTSVDFRPPSEHTLSGRVVERTCTDTTCSQTGLESVVIRATGGPGGPERTTTAGDGTYTLKLKAGTWRVEPSLADRAFEHLDAGGDGDGEGFARVVLDRDRSGVDFRACADEESDPGVDDPPTVRAATTGKGCRHFKVEFIRIKAAGDTKWTESSGKKLLGNAKVPVGFTQPTRNGDFRWQCRTGCLNVRIRVTDAATGHPVPNATVSVQVRAADGAVTADAPNGVICPALPYAEGCGERIERELGGKRDLDVYYWLPGVIERTNARIYVQVRAPGYARHKQTQNVVIVANAAIKHTLEFSGADATTLLYWGSLKKGLSFTDIPGSYCRKVIDGLNELAGGGLPSGLRYVLEQYIVNNVKKLKGLCGAIKFGDLVERLNIVTPWKLYLWFLPRFDVPRNGLLGTSHIIDRPQQLVLNFAGFFDAFNDGLVAYLYDRVNPSDPTTPSLQGNPLHIDIFEVSHRLANGKVKDALYVRFTGRQQGTPTKDYGAYVVGGYYPGCWLNPKLNEAEFSLFNLNPCKTIEP